MSRAHLLVREAIERRPGSQVAFYAHPLQEVGIRIECCDLRQGRVRSATFDAAVHRRAVDNVAIANRLADMLFKNTLLGWVHGK